MSDDLDMKALSGEIGKLALTSQRAGCDVVLNCWAKMTDMVSIAEKLARPSTNDVKVMIEKNDTNVLETQVEHPKGKKPRL